MIAELQHRDDVLRLLEAVAATRRDVLARCAELPADSLARPAEPGLWSVLQTLTHLAQTQERLLAFAKRRPGDVQPGDVPAAPPPELPAVQTALDEAMAASIAFLKSHPEAVLLEPARWPRGQTTVGGVYFVMTRHDIHHTAFVRGKLERLRG